MSIESAIEELKRVRLKIPKKQYLPDEQLIAEYEREIGVEFPEDYRLFLKEASDSMHSGKSVLRLTPERNHTHELIHELKRARDAGVPDGWLPFCEDNGDYFCFDASKHVRFWSHNGPTDESWPDFEVWLRRVWLGGE